MDDLLLPRPRTIYRNEKTVFEIYLAKQLFSHRWECSELKKLVLEARRSYYRYGRRPLLDRYDRKAAVYLVKAYSVRKLGNKYRDNPEWLSIRLVPWVGEFLGVGEPELYCYQGEPLVRQLEIYLPYLVSSSRMCGIPNQGHQYTEICFALIHVQFLIDYPLSQFPYYFISAIIRKDLWKRKLRNVKFASAYKFLNARSVDVTLSDYRQARLFPRYWLDDQGRVVPELKITKARIWYRSLKAILNKAGIDAPRIPVAIPRY